MDDRNPLPASERRIHYGQLWDARLQEASACGQAPVAVLVCHGMGQQVRYETISAVAEAIRTEAAKEGAQVDPIDVRLCRFGDDFLARAEVSWTGTQGSKHSAHVYEAYWAPLTEGKVTYRDTILFLLSAAWNGLRYSRPFLCGSFYRWMFGGPKKLTIGRFTWFGIVCVLLFVALQVGIIGYVSLALASQYKVVLSQPLPHVSANGFVVTWLRWLSPLLPGIRTIAHPASFHAWWVAALRLAIWLLIIAEAFVARYFVTEYVGDVAAYVSPYKDSKFEELRHQIQAIGFHVGQILYGFASATISPVPEYNRIIVVGHSLGSVLAYDTLNALINLDTASPPAQKRDVVGRTGSLITFGSPLDKTAFIFRTQAKHLQAQDKDPQNQQGWIREQLAAAVQPLIVDYARYRPSSFRWVNIWSPMDIISGALDYYDDPTISADDSRRVQNKIDPKARTPLAAHVQYWNNPMLREELYAALVGREQEPAAQGASGSQSR